MCDIIKWLVSNSRLQVFVFRNWRSEYMLNNRPVERWSPSWPRGWEIAFKKSWKNFELKIRIKIFKNIVYEVGRFSYIENHISKMEKIAQKVHLNDLSWWCLRQCGCLHDMRDSIFTLLSKSLSRDIVRFFTST